MNSMADNQKVYQAIKTIADELCKENKTYLRADLAFELKKYGIASDSSEVSKLVFDAYRYFYLMPTDISMIMAISPLLLFPIIHVQPLWLNTS